MRSAYKEMLQPIDLHLQNAAHYLFVCLVVLMQLWHKGTWRAPVCFMTNGGGVTEAKKAEELTSWLDVPVTEDQVRGAWLGRCGWWGGRWVGRQVGGCSEMRTVVG